MRRESLILAVLTFFLVVPLVVGQTATPLPFTMRVQQANSVLNVADGATITMPADAIGIASTAVLTVTYRGTTTTSSATLNTVDFSGSLDFTVSGIPELPLNMTPGQSFALNIQYKPSNSQRNSARVAFSYVEGRTVAGFGLNLSGTAPEFAFSYVPQGGNATIIAPSGTIPYPVTPVNTTVNASFVVTNRGTGAGVVNAITVSGGAEFQLAGLPLPATSVDAGKDLRFTVSFTPKQLPAVRGLLSIVFVDSAVAFILEGSGSGSQWAYEAGQESSLAPVSPGQLLALPDALVGEKSTIQVRVRNVGNADGRVTVISVQGAGFTLSDVPFLPVTLAPGSGSTVTITFTPAQPGRVTGRLRIGDDSFELAGSGLGATLTYAYVIGAVTTTVQNNGTVVFTPVSVGATSSVRFQVNNTGTAPSSIGSISVVSTTTVFTLTGLPALPVTMQPGATVSFNVNFLPTAQGAATATLKLDTLSFTLSGTGNPPAALPDYRFEGSSGNVEPQQQPAVGLTLSAPYPLGLTGTLTLAFNSDVFANDPAVQFASGARTVNFTIPANTTRAIFPGNQTQVRLQTGTVAGSIVLTPSFVTDGGINLTPTTPPSLTMVVPPSAPRLLSVQLSAKTSSTITILVTGYATGRTITQLDFQFAAAAEETLATTRLSIPAEASFIAWYNSTQSQQYGSLFTVTVPFNLAGEVKKATNLAETVQSVTVTLTNRQGTSTARTLELR